MLPMIVLVSLGVIFSGANVWFTAARSTIPLSIQGVISQKQLLIEKHPGVDDVYVITLDGNRKLHVDAILYDALLEKQSIAKKAWENSILVDGNVVPLTWSSDARAMIWAMPCTLLICLAVAVSVMRRSKPHV